MLTFLTCVTFMGFVAWYSWNKTRGKISTSSGNFLAENGLTGLFIGGSLLLTSISIEQLIGQNGMTYLSNMTLMVYVIFSKVGFAYAEGVVAPNSWMWFLASLAVCIAFCWWTHTRLNAKYEGYILSRFGGPQKNEL